MRKLLLFLFTLITLNTDAQLLWTKGFFGTAFQCNSKALATDNAGNVYSSQFLQIASISTPAQPYRHWPQRVH